MLTAEHRCIYTYIHLIQLIWFFFLVKGEQCWEMSSKRSFRYFLGKQPLKQVHFKAATKSVTLWVCDVKLLSCVRLFVTPWSVAHQAPLSMEFPRQEYWNGLPFPSPGDLPDPGIEPGSPALQTDSLPSGPPGKLPPYSCLGSKLPFTLSFSAGVWETNGEDFLMSFLF